MRNREELPEIAMHEPAVYDSAVRTTPKRTTLRGRRFGRISSTVELDEMREQERIAAIRILASAVDERWDTIARRSTGSRRQVD